MLIADQDLQSSMVPLATLIQYAIPNLLLTLEWRHNGVDSISNHQPHDCLLNHSDADQRKHQSSASLAFVRGIHRGPVNSPHKWPVTGKMFPFDGVIMQLGRGGSEEYFAYTVRCCYNTVNCLQNHHKRHPIARPLGRVMRYLLWVQTLIEILAQSLQWCVQYHVISECVITALDCMLLSTLPYFRKTQDLCTDNWIYGKS